jgi:hypothetical protein
VNRTYVGARFQQTVGQIALGGLEKRFFPRKGASSLEDGQKVFDWVLGVPAHGETYVDDQPIEELQKIPARGIGHCDGT